MTSASTLARPLISADLQALFVMLGRQAGVAFPYLQFLNDADRAENALHLGVFHHDQLMGALSVQEEGVMYAYLHKTDYASALADLWVRDYNRWITALLAPQATQSVLYPLLEEQLPPVMLHNLERGYDLSLRGLRKPDWPVGFRLATEADTPTLYLWRSEMMQSLHGFQDSPRLQQFINEQIEDEIFENRLFIQCNNDGMPVGTTSVRMITPTITQLQTLYIDTPWRRRGFAQPLLKGVIAASHSIGVEELVTTVRGQQPPTLPVSNDMDIYVRALEQNGFSSPGQLATLIFARDPAAEA